MNLIGGFPFKIVSVDITQQQNETIQEDRMDKDLTRKDLLVGGSVGVQIGISLCAKLGGQQLKRYFVLVIVLAWVLVAIKVIGILA